MKQLKECMIFPRDLDTFGVIKETEEYLGLSYKNINELNKMSRFKLDEYINQLTLLLYSK
jgi:hypothetical protein